MSLASAALVSLLAFLAPLLVRLIRLPVPDIVVQILFGIIVGPQVLGWARVDEPVRVLSLIGLSFLLFLAGLVAAAACHGAHPQTAAKQPARDAPGPGETETADNLVVE